MAEEIFETIDIPGIVGPNASAYDQVLAVVEAVNERIAQDVAALVKEGHTLDQIEIQRHPHEMEGNRIRLRFTVIGRRPIAD